MWFWIALAVFVVVLAKKGRIGPFLWDPGSRPALGHCAAPAASGPTRSAEGILAQRYADGDITTDEYYERLNLLQAR